MKYLSCEYVGNLPIIVQVSWDVTPCRLAVTNISKGHGVFVVKAKLNIKTE